MKKTISVILALVLTAMCLFAQGAKEIEADEVMIRIESITDRGDGSYSIEGMRENGMAVVYHIPVTAKVGYPVSLLENGDYVLMKDTGIETMSLPPQRIATELRYATPQVEAGIYNPVFAEPEALPGQIVSEEPTEEQMIAAFNYGYGYFSMQALLQQNLIVRGGYFAKGIFDAVQNGAENPFPEGGTLMDYDEMNAAIDDFYSNVYVAGLAMDYGPVYADLDDVIALPVPSELADRFSYAYGYISTMNLLYSGIDIYSGPFADGMLTALYQSEPKMTESEMNDAIDVYIAKLEAEYSQWLEEVAAENLMIAESFLEANKASEGITVLPSGVQIELLASDGASGAKPSSTDTVKVDYSLSLIDGTLVDQGTDVDFPLTSLIPGFVDAVVNMNVGDTVRAYIHPSLGYGETGNQSIAPNSLLIFDIYLKEIVK